MKKGMLSFIIGIILVLLSLPPNFSSIRESFYEQSIRKQYDMKLVTYTGTDYFIEDNNRLGIEKLGRVIIMKGSQLRNPTKSELQLVDADLKRIGEKGRFEQTFNYNNQIIKVRDQFPLYKTSNPVRLFPETASYPLEISVNDRLFQSDKPSNLNPGDFQYTRYDNLGFLLVENLSTNEESLLIIQRFGNEWKIEESLWKFLWVSKDGQIKVETFNNTERKAAPYRTAFINEAMVTPTWLGYKADGVMYYPTYFYPLLYPWLTTLVGFLLTVYGFIRRFILTKAAL